MNSELKITAIDTAKPVTRPDGLEISEPYELEKTVSGSCPDRGGFRAWSSETRVRVDGGN